jgi:hypothetical protein
LNYVDIDSPSKIFAMSPYDFQEIDLINKKRNPGKRYEIAGSFVSYIINKYGIGRFNSWLYLTDRFNFMDTFKKEFSVDFQEVENEWKNDQKSHYFFSR